MFAKDPDKASENALRNATLQGGYLILAARALGLDCGPMSGFDQNKVDETFFRGDRSAEKRKGKPPGQITEVWVGVAVEITPGQTRMGRIRLAHIPDRTTKSVVGFFWGPIRAGFGTSSRATSTSSSSGTTDRARDTGGSSSTVFSSTPSRPHRQPTRTSRTAPDPTTTFSR